MIRLLPLALALSACTADNGDNGDKDTDQPQSLPDSVTARVGPEGGELFAEGIRLSIPAFALSEEVEITLEPTNTVPAGFTPASAVWQMSPDRLQFALPAELALSTDTNADNPVMYWAEGDLPARVQTATRAGDTLIGEIAHLGTAFLAPFASEPVGTPILIGPEGGRFSFGDATMVIPEGALDSPVGLRLVDTLADPPEGYEGRSTVWAFEPQGVETSMPVEVLLPFSGTADNLKLFWESADAVYSVRPSDVQGGQLHAFVSPLTSGFTAFVEQAGEQHLAVEGRLDLLVVMDDSCSMSEEQSSLQALAPVIVPGLRTSARDWHIGVVTTDMDSATRAGRLIQAAGVRWVEDSTPNAASVLTTMVGVGVNGSGNEQGLAALNDATGVFAASINLGFEREDASLAMVIFTDEPDFSPLPVATYTANLRARREIPELLTLSLFSGGSAGCSGANGTAEVATRYLAVAAAIGGASAPICDPTTWAATLTQIINDSIAVAPITLVEVPELATLAVSRSRPGGSTVLIPDTDYRYVAASNRIYLLPEADVQAGDTVSVTW